MNSTKKLKLIPTTNKLSINFMMPDPPKKHNAIYKMKSTILRSKVKWHEQGERNTRYFYSLEKQNFEKKTTTKLKLPNGSFTTDQSGLCKNKCTFTTWKVFDTSNNHESSVPDNNLPLIFSENIDHSLRKRT